MKWSEQLSELLLQTLDTERGGIEIYRTALRCVQNGDLEEEWTKYLEQTRRHEQVVLGVFRRLKLDPDAETPGRGVVRHLGRSLVAAMEMALESGDSAAAELVATECVVLAETKDHQNWSLWGYVVESLEGEAKATVQEAIDEVEDEEDEHLYHSAGWSRELWLESLGLRAVLPPPEEEKDVKTAIGAARAKHAREAT